MPTGEISTTPIVRDALDRGKAVYIPYLHKNYPKNGNGPSSVMDMLKLHSLKEFESLKPDKWGIPTLDDETIEERENSLGGCGVGGPDSTRKWNGGLDLILMPGMAFDLNMGRLGHGKGYYDFFLRRYQDAVRGQMNEGHQKVGPFLGKLNVAPCF
jgi:5-formyltetrahydrofolate cyclo-ligase